MGGYDESWGIGFVDPRASLTVSGSQGSSIAATSTKQQIALSRSLKGELDARSGAGFSKVLSTLDASTQPRACSHRLNFVRPARDAGSSGRTKKSVPLKDAWWANKAAEAAASKREMMTSLMSVKAAQKFTKLRVRDGTGEEGGDSGKRSSPGRNPTSPGAGGTTAGAYHVEEVVKITDEEIEAQREFVWNLWEKMKPAHKAAELATEMLGETADKLWNAAYEELAAARVGERSEDKEYYDLAKIVRPSRTMTTAAACVILALDQLLAKKPINSFEGVELGEAYKKGKRELSAAWGGARGDRVRSGAPSFVVTEDIEGKTWRELCEHLLFGDVDMIDEMMNQLWAHVAWLAYDGGGKLLAVAETIARGGDPIAERSGEFDDEDDDEKPRGLPEQCVRVATKAAQDINFCVSGDLGRGDDIENGVLKFFITWTKQVAHVDRKMQVARRQHVPIVQAYAKLARKHEKANKELEEMEAAFMTMKSAEQALLEEAEDEDTYGMYS